MHSLKVHSNESACIKSGRLGLEQVIDVIHLLFFPRWLVFISSGLKDTHLVGVSIFI